MLRFESEWAFRKFSVKSKSYRLYRDSNQFLENWIYHSNVWRKQIKCDYCDSLCALRWLVAHLVMVKWYSPVDSMSVWMGQFVRISRFEEKDGSTMKQPKNIIRSASACLVDRCDAFGLRCFAFNLIVIWLLIKVIVQMWSPLCDNVITDHLQGIYRSRGVRHVPRHHLDFCIFFENSVTSNWNIRFIQWDREGDEGLQPLALGVSTTKLPRENQKNSITNYYHRSRLPIVCVANWDDSYGLLTSREENTIQRERIGYKLNGSFYLRRLHQQHTTHRTMNRALIKR